MLKKTLDWFGENDFWTERNRKIFWLNAASWIAKLNPLLLENIEILPNNVKLAMAGSVDLPALPEGQDSYAGIPKAVFVVRNGVKF